MTKRNTRYGNPPRRLNTGGMFPKLYPPATAWELAKVKELVTSARAAGHPAGKVSFTSAVQICRDLRPQGRALPGDVFH